MKLVASISAFALSVAVYSFVGKGMDPTAPLLPGIILTIVGASLLWSYARRTLTITDLKQYEIYERVCAADRRDEKLCYSVVLKDHRGRELI